VGKKPKRNMKREGAKAQSKKEKFPSLPLCLFALSLVLLAFFVRFHLLGAQSFWNDEGNSYVQATRPLTEIPFHAARDIHPPGYYWLLHLWRIFTGDTEFALRSLSAFASVLTAAFTFALGRRLYGPAAGLAAALLVALNTFQIHYAQEARMYALLALWGAAGMWALVGLIQRQKEWGVRATHESSLQHPTLRWALALALINAAGLWTQYAYPFVMLAQGVVFVVWFVERWANRTRMGVNRAPLQRLGIYIAANLLTIGLYLPWLPNALTSLTTWPSTGQPVPLREAVSVILGWLTLGMTVSVTDSSWVAVALLLMLFGLRLSHPVRGLWRLILPVAWAALPVLIFLAAGLFREGNLKLLLPAQAGLALWMGRGAAVLWDLPHPRFASFASLSPLWRSGWGVRLTRAAALFGVLGLAVNLGRGLEPLYHHPAFQRDDYRGIVAKISRTLRPDDAIILNAPNQEEVFRYYYAGDAPVYPLPPGLGGDDAAARAAVEQVIAGHARIFAVFWGDAERDPQRVVETTLNAQAFEAASQWYGHVRLVRYATPVEPEIARESGAQFGDYITLERFALSSDSVTPGDVLQVRLDWRTRAALDERYKVFVQLLDSGGALVAQHDSEPGGGFALTTTWQPGAVIADQHGLLIPDDLSPAHYTLIIGLYDSDDPQQRLRVGEADHLILSEITIQ
jgi:mannosyltransferase